MHWVLTGHVQLFTPQGHLKADRATIQIVNDRITIVTAQGDPAEFERSEDSPLPSMPPNAQTQLQHAHGHAREIVFDVERNQLDFSGDAYFIANCYELGSQHVVYDMANQKVQGDSSDNSRVSGSFKCGPGAQKP
jgi:lipopolysaccharide transport protein LptA